MCPHPPVQLTLKQIEYLKQGVRSLRENRPVKASMHATVENPAGEVYLQEWFEKLYEREVAASTSAHWVDYGSQLYTQFQNELFKSTFLDATVRHLLDSEDWLSRTRRVHRDNTAEVSLCRRPYLL